jgi:hypothetical protein
MNRLPKVLQNEIWEYVRGDRAYWKQTLTESLDSVPKSEMCEIYGFTDGFLLLIHAVDWQQWWIQKYDKDCRIVSLWPFKSRKEDALISWWRLKDRHKH